MSADDNLALAVAVLGELPVRVEAYRSDGAAIGLEIDAQVDGHLEAGLPWHDAREGMGLVIPVRSAKRGGYEIGCRVSTLYFEGDGHGRAELAVTAVARRKPTRAAERRSFTQLALVRVSAGKAVTPGVEFDVRLVDLSVRGVAFTTQQRLVRGDIISLGTSFEGKACYVGARVIYTTQVAYGRRRVGCELVEPSEQLVGQLTALLEGLPATGGAVVDRQIRAAA